MSPAELRAAASTLQEAVDHLRTIAGAPPQPGDVQWAADHIERVADELLERAAADDLDAAHGDPEVTELAEEDLALAHDDDLDGT